MTGSVHTRHRYRVDARPPSRSADGWRRPQHIGSDRRTLLARRGHRRILGVFAILVVAAVAVVLLDAAGFDHRVAAGSIAVLAGDVFASWLLINRASRGSPRRPTGSRSRR